eukprot:gene1509-1901_t
MFHPEDMLEVFTIKDLQFYLESMTIDPICHRILVYLHQTYPNLFESISALDLLTSNASLESIQYLHEKGEDATFRAVNSAAIHPTLSLEIIKYLHMNRLEGCNRKALVNAITCRHFETVYYLLENYQHCFTRDKDYVKSCLAVLAVGDLSITKILVERIKDIQILKNDTSDLFINATVGNKIDCVRYLYSTVLPSQAALSLCVSDCISIAINNNNLEMIDYFIQIVPNLRSSIEIDSYKVRDFVGFCKSRMDILDLIKNDSRVNKRDLDENLYQNEEDFLNEDMDKIMEAISIDDLSTLKSLVNKNLEFLDLEDLFRESTKEGRLEITKFLLLVNPKLEVGYEVSNILYNGHYQLFEYLLDQGSFKYQRKIHTLLPITDTNCLRIFKKFYEKYPQLPVETAQVDVAIKNSCVEVLDFLLKQGYGTSNLSCYNYAYKDLRILKMLYSKYGKIKLLGSTPLDNAASSGCLNAVHFLVENYGPIENGIGIDLAAKKGNIDVVRYLFKSIGFKFQNEKETFNVAILNGYYSICSLRILKLLLESLNPTQDQIIEIIQVAKDSHRVQLLNYLNGIMYF